MPTEHEIANLRACFRILRRKIYLYSCSQGALSDAVEMGTRAYLESWFELATPWDTWMEKYEAARAVFARFIGAKRDEVAILTSASAGINAIASCFLFKERKKW